MRFRDPPFTRRRPCPRCGCAMLRKSDLGAAARRGFLRWNIFAIVDDNQLPANAHEILLRERIKAAREFGLPMPRRDDYRERRILPPEP
jgi:hypothetical protein